MIIVEIINGICERRYSDKGVKLRQIETDTLWNDAINVIPCSYTYEETETPIPDTEIDPQEALDILMGGSDG